MFGRLWRIGLAGLALACVSGTAVANNCRYLEMQLMQLQGGSARDGELRNVRAMLRNNGCMGERPAAATSSFGDNFFGNFRRRSERSTAHSTQDPSSQTRTQRSAPSGTYRTLCVRRCDGYYFPISFSTTRDHLAVDEAMCGQLWVILRVASMPFITGSWRSMRITSGCNSRACSTARPPSSASPTS